jgi:hypothetical protein
MLGGLHLIAAQLCSTFVYALTHTGAQWWLRQDVLGNRLRWLQLAQCTSYED